MSTTLLFPTHPGARRTRILLLSLLFLALCLGREQSARAQQQLAAVQGLVKDQDTGKPLGSVTVVVNGPALPEFQSEVTDASGRYIITQLPPGDDYQVSFYFGADDKPRIVQKGIRLSLGKTITVNANIALSAGKREVKVIKETAPNVDTASASTGVEVNQEVLQNTPVRGRTYESVIALAPGVADVAPHTGANFAAAGGDIGVQISGSTGGENNFIIDGLNTSDPNLGVIGTELSQYFIKEVNVITGGYQAEYGRATGGVVSIATKSGGNEFHGSLFGSIQPYQLPPRGVARLGEALITYTKTDLLFDVGFELGGPIKRDHIWFYVGFAPTTTFTGIDRRGRHQFFDPMGKAPSYAQVDANFQCPSYLASQALCDGPSTLALRTEELDYGQHLQNKSTLYNGILKLQFNFNPDHNISLTYIASPTTFDGFGGIRNVDLSTQRYGQTSQVHDGIFHYIGKVLNRKLQFDVLYGYHYQSSDVVPEVANKPEIQWFHPPTNPYSLYDFESVPDCQRQSQMVPGMAQPVTFNPCPLTTYLTGFGGYNSSVLQRHQVIASATYFLHLTQKWNPIKGIHAFKAGFEFEDLESNNFRTYTGTNLDPNDPTSGHRVYSSDSSGTQLQIFREYASQNPLNGTITHLNGFRGVSDTHNFAVYLRDSWSVGWVPGLQLNLGLRWEGQQVFGSDIGHPGPAVSILDNWAPRVGLVYDFTQLTSRPGRSKLFFNYGRFYESVPLDINDRQFTGEGLYANTVFFPGCDTRAFPGRSGMVTQLPFPSAGCNFDLKDPAGINGGRYPLVAPGLKGQYINEVVLGFNYDIGFDVVLGISYIHRDLGNIVEDMSPDGGQTYIIANPGVPADPALIKQLEDDVARLKTAGTAANASMQDQLDYQDAVGRLSAYKLTGTVFPRARRDYDALVLTLNKRLSNRFSIVSSYTYSRTIGNYPGTFSSSNGQADPNISSQFDLINLLSNRNGPLPTDRPHNFKATGFYNQPIGGRGILTIGLTFTAVSGRPIEVLGRHPTYGRREVFILPRGSGGRTPMVTQFDLHVGYEHRLSKLITLSLFGDIVNLFDQREIINVDDEFTLDVVDSIVNGKVEDLKHLKGIAGANNGKPISFNSNYGQPTAFQAPMFIRLGGRLSF